MNVMDYDDIKYVSSEFFKISESAQNAENNFFGYCHNYKVWDDEVYKSFDYYSSSLKNNLSSAEFYIRKMKEIQEHVDSFDCSADESAVNSLISSL